VPVLSIQSSVAYGHVGNAAAVFPLQLLGHEVWPVSTVSFSNHPQYGGWRGRVHDAGEVREIIRGIEERDAFERCDAVLSGYLGDPSVGAVVADTVDAVKAARWDAIYCLDPVMGDVDRGFFVRPGIPEYIREHLVRRADVVMPNAFELAYLAGQPVMTVAEAAEAARALRSLGAGDVVVTGLDEGGEIAVIAVTADGAWRAAAPRIEAPAYGAGDLFSALYLGHVLAGRDVPTALSRAVASTYGVFAATRALRRDSLAIIESREEILAPGRAVVASPL